MSDAKKTKKRINVIDVVIILLVLSLIATAGYRIYEEVTKNISSKQSNCVLSFECTVTNAGILDYLKNGDAVYLTKDGTLLGYIFDPASGDGQAAVYRVVEKDEENVTNGKITLRGTIKLNIDARKAKNGNYYVINGTNITDGGTLAVYTEKAVMSIVVKSLSTSK